MAAYEFDRVYLDHKDQVWRLVNKYVAGQHDREDLFQEVFLKVHQALPKFRGDSSLETWLYRLTVNTAINYVKKQKRYKLFSVLLAGLRFEESIPTSDVEATSLLKPLEKLNPRQRTILLLADVEEYKLEEIARLMELPVGTVKSNLARSRAIMQKELKQNDRL
ncbi:MAG: sigma-70 family RNA polymerase sigma factor [Candidatus Margulisiibacteriota bacterium]